MTDHRQYVREKVNATTEEELRQKATGFRVVNINWDGPGWYFIYHYSQRCPRGCCFDNVFEAQSASDRASEIQSKMRNLANDLKEARELAAQKT